MGTKNTLKTFAILGLFIIIAADACGIYASATLPIGEPEQIQNENWTVSLGSTEGGILTLQPIPETNDVIFAGHKINTTARDYYVGRISESGQVNWVYEFFDYDGDLLSMYISPDGGQVFIFFKHRITTPDLIHELWVYTIDVETGGLIAQSLVDPGTFGLSVNNYMSVTSNPANTDELYVVMSNFTSSGNWYSTRLFAWSLSQESVLWNKNFTSGSVKITPSKMLYHSGQNRLILITHAYTNAIDKVGTLWKIEPIAIGGISQTIIYADSSNLIVVNDFEIYLDKIYLLMQVSDTISPDLIYRYIQIRDMAFTVLDEVIIPPVKDYFYTKRIRVINEDRLVIMGESYFELISEHTTHPETYIQAYQFDEARDRLSPVGMWRFKLKDKYFTADAGYVLPNGCYVVAGYTNGIMLGETVGYISQFPSLYNDPGIDDCIPVSDLPFLERFLQQDWLIAGSIGGVGFLIGALLIGLLAKKK